MTFQPSEQGHGTMATNVSRDYWASEEGMTKKILWGLRHRDIRMTRCIWIICGATEKQYWCSNMNDVYNLLSKTNNNDWWHKCGYYDMACLNYLSKSWSKQLDMIQLILTSTLKKGWDCRYLLARYVNSLLWTKLMLRAHIVMFNPVIIFLISKQTIKCVDTVILFVKNT
jgi:hypothetical protein